MQKICVENFYFLKVGIIWAHFRAEHFSFWMICGYIFFEYARPQSIFPVIDFLPWAQIFILGALSSVFLDKSVRWVNSSISYTILAFSLVIFISSVTAIYPEISSEHYINLYSWVVIYFLIIHIVNSKKRYYIFLLIFVVCAAKIAIGTSKTWALRGFSFASWGLSGPKGYFQNSGELAILMLTLFPVSYKLYLFLKDKVSRLEKYVLLIFTITPVLTIVGASSRGSQIALLLQLILLFRKGLFRIKSLVMVVALSFFLYELLPEEQKNRFSTTGEDKTSQQRLLYWEHGIDMILEYPVLGVGYFNFARYYADHFPEDMLYEHAELPHNIFIQVGTDAGFMGLIPFSYLIFWGLWTGWKVRKHIDSQPMLTMTMIGTSYGILGFTIAGQFVTVAYYPFLWIGLAFLVSGNNVLRQELKKS